MKNKSLHRDNDQPTLVFKSGTKLWFKKGELYRLNGPAIEYYDGIKDYYINGKRLSKKEFDKYNKEKLDKD